MLAVLLVVADLPSRAAAPGEVQARLREAIQMPSFSLELNFGYTAEQGLEAWDPPINPPVEIAKLERAMTGGLGDGTNWLKIAKLRAQLKDDPGATAARAKAVAVFRRQLAAQPGELQAMAALGDALPQAESDEAERLLRAAVAKAPGVWWCQLALAKFLHSQALTAQMSGEKVPATAEVLAKARTLSEEAGRHFDLAVELAPGQHEPPLQRAMFHWMRAMYPPRGSDGAAAHPDSAAVNETFKTAVLPDLRRARAASPDDFRLVALQIWMLVISSMPEDGAHFSVDRLPETVRRELLDGVAKLRRLAEQASSSERAAATWEALGMLQMGLLQDRRGAEESVASALKLQPGRPRAWNLRAGLLLDSSDNRAAFQAFLEETLRRTNTAKVRLFLAKVQFEAKRPEAAAASVAEALKLEPDDLPARACDLTLRLQSAKTEMELSEVQRSLEDAIKRLESFQPESERPTLAQHLWTTIAIHVALTGEMAEADQLIRQVRERFPESEYAKEVAEILLAAPGK